MSNLQILGAIDGLRAKIEALTAMLESADLSGGGARSVDAPPPAAVTGGQKVKRRRAKSKYNDHMSEELARLKELHPDLGHRRRFAMAVQSWKDIKAGQAQGSSDVSEEDVEGETAAA